MNIEVYISWIPPSKNTWYTPNKLAYQYNLTYESLLILFIQIYLSIACLIVPGNKLFTNLRFWHVEQNS